MKREFWFIVGSQFLYGEEVLQIVDGRAREMAEELGVEHLTAMHVDALSAIMLHNSLYKFAIAFYKDKNPEKRKPPLRMELHPLAWLLMLCDELQCWDRTAYGRNSRRELHPLAASFDFTGQAIKAVYFYDIAEQKKIEKRLKKLWLKPKNLL